MSEAVLKVATSNANEKLVPYIKQRVSGQGVANDIRIETYVPTRTAQINLANYTVVKLVVPGDPGLTAGTVVEFNLMTIKPSLTQKELNPYYSGKYLITAVRHIIRPLDSTYQTIIEIAKESSATPIEQSDNSNSEVRQAVNT